MKLPKKIDPDRIKDSIVEVRFKSKLPIEVYLGMFYQSLDDSYKYTNRQLAKQKFPINFPIEGPKEIKLTLGSIYIFYNDLIKFEIQPNSIIFNCLDKYPTWERYFPEIEKVLHQIEKANVIETFTRVGVRYLSEYPDTELTEITKYSFSFGMPVIKSDAYSFRTEFSFEDHKVILNLSNKLPVIKQQTNNTQLSITKLSSVDVDVIKDGLDINDVNNLLNVINVAHNKEKEVFFNILTEKFLNTLNPIY